jgi:Ca2+ regulator and membrane fusion protein Fig1
LIFLGICGKTGSSVSCAPSAGKSVTNLAPALFPGNTSNSTLSLLQFALITQTKIIIPVIIAGGVTFLLGVLSLLNLKWQERRMLASHKASSASQSLRRLKSHTVLLLWLSVMFAFGASLSSNISVGALAFTTDSFKTQFTIQAGKALQAIQWTKFTLVFLFSAGVTEMLWARNGHSAGSSYDSSRRDAWVSNSYPDGPPEGGSPPY